MYNNIASIFLMAPSGGGGGIMDFLPLILIVVVFYFFMIRPQLKKQKEQKTFRESLAKGDKVVTIGGVHGKIVEVKEDLVHLEIAANVVVKVDKNAVSADFATSNTPSQTNK